MPLPKVYDCGHCGKACTSPADLVHHIIEAHPERWSAFVGDNTPSLVRQHRNPGADACGVRVVMVDRPIFDLDVRVMVRAVPPSTIEVDSSFPRAEVLPHVMRLRHELAEKLPPQECDAFRSDLARAQIKIDPPSPILRAADGRFLCPHCTKPYQVWGTLRSHVLFRHRDGATAHAMLYQRPKKELPIAGRRNPDAA